MADTVSVERVIPASADRIFAVLADPRRHPEIDGSGTVRQAVSGPSRLGPGAVFGMDMRMGAPYRMINTVVEFEEGRRIAWQPRPSLRLLGLLVGGRIWRYELEPAPAGTLVRETWDISGERLPMLMRPLAETVRRGMTASLERLAEAVR